MQRQKRWPDASFTAMGTRPCGLAAEYGFTDLGGSQPDAWRYLLEAETNNVADQR